MSDEKKGLASMTQEQRAEVMKKAHESRRQNAESRRKMLESGVEFKSPIKAIREKCLDCCGGSYTEVELCTVPDCALFPYRMGKRPRDFDDLQVKTKPMKDQVKHDDFPEIDLE